MSPLKQLKYGHSLRVTKRGFSGGCFSLLGVGLEEYYFRISSGILNDKGNRVIRLIIDYFIL